MSSESLAGGWMRPGSRTREGNDMVLGAATQISDEQAKAMHAELAALEVEDGRRETLWSREELEAAWQWTNTANLLLVEFFRYRDGSAPEELRERAREHLGLNNPARFRGFGRGGGL